MQVLIGMGSNIEPEANLVQAAAALRDRFGPVRFSSVYRSAAVGMQGNDFLNACCLFATGLSQQEVTAELKALEDAQLRDRSRGSWKPRTLDLDVLVYDGRIVDDELYLYAHASVPASELLELDLPGQGQGALSRIALRL